VYWNIKGEGGVGCGVNFGGGEDLKGIVKKKELSKWKRKREEYQSNLLLHSFQHVNYWFAKTEAFVVNPHEERVFKKAEEREGKVVWGGKTGCH